MTYDIYGPPNFYDHWKIADSKISRWLAQRNLHWCKDDHKIVVKLDRRPYEVNHQSARGGRTGVEWHITGLHRQAHSTPCKLSRWK